MLVCLFIIISFVTLTLEIFGRVESTDNTTEVTLNNIKIKVGHTKKAFDKLSSFGTRLESATEIIMAFTESKILAFVSAMALNSM